MEAGAPGLGIVIVPTKVGAPGLGIVVVEVGFIVVVEVGFIGCAIDRRGRETTEIGSA
jgi:hypothetical protein